MTFTFEEVLDFWFHQLKPKDWFTKSSDVDREIRRRFASLHEAATRGELFPWRRSIQGRLAEILVLDQFSRNLYRDDPRAFASDGMALVLAQEAVLTGEASTLPPMERAFLYMPFMHSESLAIHDVAEKLFSEPGLEENLDFEIRHRRILERFGRYPHRNAALGRPSTEQELEFLKTPGSGF